jgi:hypothetical protein
LDLEALGQQPAKQRVLLGEPRNTVAVWPLNAVQVELEPIPSGRLASHLLFALLKRVDD